MSKPKTLQIGDTVRHNKYGMGFVHQIDPSDRDFHYDIHFPETMGGDGTMIWMSKKDAERRCKVVHRLATPPAVIVMPNGVYCLAQ